MEIAEEMVGYGDIRLEKKGQLILDGFVNSGSSSVHKTFPVYNDLKSCYRFLDNPKVKESLIIEKMRQSCKRLVTGKKLIAIADSSRICVDKYFGRIKDHDGIGILSKNQFVSSYGFMAHPLYIVDHKDGTPYGFANVELYNRPMEDNPLNVVERRKKSYKQPIEEKESWRWIGPSIEARDTILSKSESITFVFDREADIFEVYKLIPNETTSIVVRGKEDRKIINSEGEHTKLKEQLKKQKSIGSYEIELPKKKGRTKNKVNVEIKTGQCKVNPKKNRKADIPVDLTFVEIKQVREKGGSEEDLIHWILWTDQKVETADQAIEIVKIYARRWDIEVFFKLLKSDGFNIESCQLGSGRSIRKLTLIIMEASLKILQLKAAREGDTSLKVSDMFDYEEIECLELLNEKLAGRTEKQKNPYPKNHLSWASWVIARLGGWKQFYEKKNLPGNKTYKHGLEKFEALVLGYSLAK